MSNLTRFMEKARAMIDAKQTDGARPELFHRTGWLFTELDEAVAKLHELGVKLKGSSVARDKAMTIQLNAEMAEIATQILNMNICLNKEFEKG